MCYLFICTLSESAYDIMYIVLFIMWLKTIKFAIRPHAMSIFLQFHIFCLLSQYSGTYLTELRPHRYRILARSYYFGSSDNNIFPKKPSAQSTTIGLHNVLSYLVRGIDL